MQSTNLTAPPPATHEQANREPRIVLTWVLRLRWLAIAGQLVATIAAQSVLGLDLPMVPILGLIAITAISNALLSWRTPRVERVTQTFITAILAFDVLILTGLLYLTGGPENPFSVLYVVHVAMAVVVLESFRVWVVVMVAAVAYAFLFQQSLPLAPNKPLSATALSMGRWVSLVLVAGLITYFVGRLTGELRRREAAMTQMRDRAARTERLAALTTLAAGAAHQLGTPLGTIAVVAREVELAAQSGQSVQGDVAADAQLIRREVDRCRAILNRMRVEIVDNLSHHPREIEVEELVRDLVEELRDGEADRLDVHRPPELRRVLAPRVALLQSLATLVHNAFDATGPAGRVVLRLEPRHSGTAFIIEDRGEGMSDEVFRRAGEPFFTTKPTGQGMGMGLFLVRLVAEEYGGNFRLESTPGEGTKATLELPIQPRPLA